MTTRSWIRNLLRPAARKIRPARHTTPLAMEPLEDRLAPASIADYGQMPISFVPNLGQTRARPPP